MTTRQHPCASGKASVDRRAFLISLIAVCVSGATSRDAFSSPIENPFGRFGSSGKRPAEIERGAFAFQVDFELSEIASELASLDEVAAELSSTLKIPAPREKILARVLPDEASWRAFFQKTFPGVAYRTAMFERKEYLFDARKERLYAFRGPTLEVDLRHEGTHALLAASLRRSVPIWLDEGLAEYFEETPRERAENPDRTTKVVARLENGSFAPLERLESVSVMTAATNAFYLDSWAWTNYLLNDSSETRAIVSEYLNDLARSRPFAPKISARLKKTGGGEEALRRFYRARLQALQAVDANRREPPQSAAPTPKPR